MGINCVMRNLSGYIADRLRVDITDAFGVPENNLMEGEWLTFVHISRTRDDGRTLR